MAHSPVLSLLRLPRILATPIRAQKSRRRLPTGQWRAWGASTDNHTTLQLSNGIQTRKGVVWEELGPLDGSRGIKAPPRLRHPRRRGLRGSWGHILPPHWPACVSMRLSFLGNGIVPTLQISTWTHRRRQRVVDHMHNRLSMSQDWLSWPLSRLSVCLA